MGDDQNKQVPIDHQYFIVHPVPEHAPKPDDSDMCLNLKTQTKLILNGCPSKLPTNILAETHIKAETLNDVCLPEKGALQFVCE